MLGFQSIDYKIFCIRLADHAYLACDPQHNRCCISVELDPNTGVLPAWGVCGNPGGDFNMCDLEVINHLIFIQYDGRLYCTMFFRFISF